MHMTNVKRIGQILLDEGIISHEQLAVALKEHKVLYTEKLGDIVVKFGFCKKDDVVSAMTKHCPEALIGNNVTNAELPKKFLLDTQTVNRGPAGEFLYISTLHKNPEWVKNEAQRLLKNKFTVKLVPCSIKEIRKFILDNSNEELIENADIETIDDANIIHDTILNEAMEKRASDIHIIQREKTIEIRYRVDGRLGVKHILDKDKANELYPLIKGMTNMDITQTRSPQDGSYSTIYNGRVIDLRIAVKPIKDGEKITIRILDKEGRLNKTLDEIGITPVEQFKKLLKLPNGVILVCGETGSGKTTTLYAAIQTMDILHENISTIEDPIEYTLPNIVQTQINRLVKLDFADFVRTEMRHDPDKIMVGEIRDLETCQNCFVLSDTGHLVLSSLHSNDFPTTLTRLENLQVDMNHLALVLRGVLIQRLVRKIHKECKSKGCEECDHTGYYDRIPIVEFAVIENPDDLKKAKTGDLKYYTFMEDAEYKVRSGLTDCKEVSRVMGIDTQFCKGNNCISGGAKCI